MTTEFPANNVTEGEVYAPPIIEKATPAFKFKVPNVPELKVNIKQDYVSSEVATKPTEPGPTFKQEPVVVEIRLDKLPPKKKVLALTLKNVTCERLSNGF